MKKMISKRSYERAAVTRGLVNIGAYIDFNKRSKHVVVAGVVTSAFVGISCPKCKKKISVGAERCPNCQVTIEWRLEDARIVYSSGGRL